MRSQKTAVRSQKQMALWNWKSVQIMISLNNEPEKHLLKQHELSAVVL